MRPRSEREIQDYLKRKTLDRKIRIKNRKTGEYSTQFKKGYDTSLVPLVLKRLNDSGYIDDERFATVWVENHNISKGASEKKLRLELQQKGIKQSIIEKVLAESDRDEREELRKIIARKAKKYPDEQKLIQHLLRQGFNYSDISDALSSIDSSSV
jgi:regulatory protein